MYTAISANLLLFTGVIVIVLTGQMSHGDTALNITSNNSATKQNATKPLQSNVAPVAEKKIDGPEKAVVAEVKPAKQPAESVPAAAPPAVPNKAPNDGDDVDNIGVRNDYLDKRSEIPDTIQTGFYIFVAFGLVVIFYISYRSYR